MVPSLSLVKNWSVSSTHAGTVFVDAKQLCFECRYTEFHRSLSELMRLSCVRRSAFRVLTETVRQERTEMSVGVDSSSSWNWCFIPSWLCTYKPWSQMLCQRLKKIDKCQLDNIVWMVWYQTYLKFFVSQRMTFLSIACFSDFYLSLQFKVKTTFRDQPRR